MADIGAFRLRALRETVAGFAGDALVSRQEILVILDAAMRAREAETTLDAVAFELDAYTTATKSLRLLLRDAREQIASLTAAINGRTTPPTLAEIQAHAVNRGGWWLVVEENDFGTYLIEREADIARYVGRSVRWVACDACGCPCSWPLVPVGEAVREHVSPRAGVDPWPTVASHEPAQAATPEVPGE